jgi:CRISPR-associated protein Csb2
LHLSGMLRRCAAGIAPALEWDDKHVSEFVLGHGEKRGEGHEPVAGPRLIFIPLPSIEFRGEAKGRTVGSIRRVLVTVKGGLHAAEFSSIVRALEGQELIDEESQVPVAFLRKASACDNAIADFFKESREWVTVTPVILPGYDDRGKLRKKLNEGKLTPKEKGDVVTKLENRIDTLFRKAMRQAGFPEQLISDAEIRWRGSGFIQGADLATNYAVPDQHRRYRRAHCRIVFKKPVRGPICIGGGRFSGLGLFAAVADNIPPC